MGHNPRRIITVSPKESIQSPSAPVFPLNPTTIPAWFFPQNRRTPFWGTVATFAVRRITFTVTTSCRSISRIYPPLLQFQAHPSRVGLRLRAGASPVLRLRPPQAKQTGSGAYHPAACPPFPYISRIMKYRGELHILRPPQAAYPSYFIALRWRRGGDIYCPSPSPPGFPRSKAKLILNFPKSLIPPFLYTVPLVPMLRHIPTSTMHKNLGTLPAPKT
jgi:hypothetical protein